jgi:hypothetical protein
MSYWLIKFTEIYCQNRSCYVYFITAVFVKIGHFSALNCRESGYRYSVVSANDLYKKKKRSNVTVKEKL